MQFVRTDDSESLQDDLFTVDKIDMMDGDRVAGYIKLSYIPSSVDFNLFRFLRLKGHQVFVNDEWELQDVTDPAKRSRIAYHIANCSGNYSWDDCNAISKDAATTTDDLRIFLYAVGVMDAIEHKFHNLHQQYIGYHVDNPLVDFIRVMDDYQGNNLSIELYKEAAKWMGEKGMRVHLCSLPGTTGAGAIGKIREKMLSADMLYTVMHRWYNKPVERYVIKNE